MTDHQERAPGSEGVRGDPWRYERFLAEIEREAGLDRDHAERAAMATLATLAERIPRSGARELAEDLPERLRRYAGRDDVVVLGLPRGGVPVACEVARALDALLDVFVVRRPRAG